MSDTLNVRTGHIDKQPIKMGVEFTQPICISDDAVITAATLRSETGSSINAPAFADREQQDRYVFLNSLKSPLTGSTILFWYDKQFEDILITPPMSFFALANPTERFDMRVARLGGQGQHPDYSLNNKYPVTEDARFKLKTPGTSLTFKAHLLLMPATVQEGLFNYSTGEFEEQVNAINLIHKVKRMLVLIELGTLKEVFPNNETIPTTLLYQFSINEYGIKDLGLLSPSSKLYLPLQF